jgi:hypothetical protein
MATNWGEKEQDPRILRLIASVASWFLPRTFQVQEFDFRMPVTMMYFSFIELGWHQRSPQQAITGFDSLHSEFAELCDALSELEEANNG